MHWFTLMALLIVAGAIVGGIVGDRLARRFIETTSTRLAIYSAAIVALIIVGISAVFAAYLLASGFSTTREYDAIMVLYLGSVFAVFAAGAGEVAALWAIRRIRR